jgi:hypothetical protein
MAPHAMAVSSLEHMWRDDARPVRQTVLCSSDNNCRNVTSNLTITFSNASTAKCLPANGSYLLCGNSPRSSSNST